MIPCAMSGASGRMGRAIISLMAGGEGPLTLSGALDHPQSIALDRDAGEVCGTGNLGIPIVASPEKALTGAQVAIDFSSVEGSLQVARLCAEKGIALVVGTTGFREDQKEELTRIAERIPLLISPNMSFGVNLLFHLVQVAAASLGDGYDLEVVEVHHRHKKDAPSGTAVRLKEILLDAMGRSEEDVIYGRNGITGERAPREIAVHALRGGDVVGDHTVHFMADGERLELTHRASSRSTFARGAIMAAAYLADKRPGLYSMKDVLRLK